MLRQGEMSFRRIRLQPTDSLNGCVAQSQPRRSMFKVTKINLIVGIGELVLGKDEIRIARDSLIKQGHGFIKILARLVENGAFDQNLSARIKIVGGQIG